MTSLQKIPATVITGFLGAGKTTLVRHLLENARGRRIAVVVNEFGSLGIDGELLKSCGIPGCAEDTIIELANGCICCTVADDFLPTMEALLARPEPPEHIVIETSGLALPKPLLKAFDWPAVRSRMTVDGVIAVIDGPAVAEGRFADDPAAVAAQRAADASLEHDNPLAEVFEDQLAAADLVILNKMDLLDPAALKRLEAAIAERAPRPLRTLHSTEGRVDPAVLLGLAAAAEDDLAARPSHHDGLDDHEHDDFTSFVVQLPHAVADPARLLGRLEAVAEDHAILRLKGFLAVEDKALRLLVQGVGRRFRHHYDRPWRRDEPRVGRLVVIAEQGIDEAAVRRAIPGAILE
jgi:cobalamin biosynthesis protein CobW